MRARLLLGTIAICLMLGGCGLYRWEKPGAGSIDFKNDSAACQAQAGDQGYGDCMKARGWTLID